MDFIWFFVWFLKGSGSLLVGGVELGGGAGGAFFVVLHLEKMKPFCACVSNKNV